MYLFFIEDRQVPDDPGPAVFKYGERQIEI
jgi:hypothetical protein